MDEKMTVMAQIVILNTSDWYLPKNMSIRGVDNNCRRMRHQGSKSGSRCCLSIDTGMIVVLFICIMYIILVFGLLFYVKNEWCDLLFKNMTVSGSDTRSHWSITNAMLEKGSFNFPQQELVKFRTPPLPFLNPILELSESSSPQNALNRFLCWGKWNELIHTWKVLVFMIRDVDWRRCNTMSRLRWN